MKKAEKETPKELTSNEQAAANWWSDLQIQKREECSPPMDAETRKMLRGNLMADVTKTIQEGHKEVVALFNDPQQRHIHELLRYSGQCEGASINTDFSSEKLATPKLPSARSIS